MLARHFVSRAFITCIFLFSAFPAHATIGVPSSGLANSTVVLRGTNFTGTTTVWFNGQAATFTLNSPNQITATVPAGATTGPLSVSAAGGISTSSTTFTVNSLVVFGVSQIG